MHQIRILYIVGAFSTSGGVESVVSNICNNIDRSNIKIDFLLFNGLDHSRKYVLEAHECKIYYINRIRKGVIRFVLEIYKILRCGRYDIVHSHINEIGLVAAFAGTLARTPVRICHSHNTQFSNAVLIPFLQPLFRVFPTHLFACSNAAGIALFGDKANFTVINNAIDAQHYSFNSITRERVRSSLGIVDKFVIGHVGRFSHQKNHNFIIDIYQKVLESQVDTVLLLVGDGELETEIKNKALRLGIEKQILFLGGRNDVNELLQGMDVFLFPSHYEGLGLALIEAQSSGLPCVVSDTVTREVAVTNLVQFLSLDESLDYWANTLLRYSNGYDRRNTFSEIVCSGYEIKSSTEKLQSLYEKVLEG